MNAEEIQPTLDTAISMPPPVPIAVNTVIKVTDLKKIYNGVAVLKIGRAHV